MYSPKSTTATRIAKIKTLVSIQQIMKKRSDLKSELTRSTTSATSTDWRKPVARNYKL